jgi:DNA invertase Pin-like site-specific DNA recombinase
MKTTTRQRAILYIRVSTDEQAEKGYSLKHQEERITQYCNYQNIEIVAIYKEDHSAKSFERPEFKKLLAFLKKGRGVVDLLLFLKWDRFSRNAGDAYAMINQLNRLGVDPQAIEQPLDLSIPENKIMLAFYLAAPEVENDRRSLNTIAGMRRAMKEGRHVTLAPRGYKNVRNEQNKPIIEPNGDAPFVKEAFEEVAKGINTIVDVWRSFRAKGFKVSKNQFWNMLRNPVYCGQIFIPAYKDEDEMLVPATHEPLISIGLFNDVQDVLHGRKRKFPKKNAQKKEFPLRGFLECRKCGAVLTGSASKGNGGSYFYYHCQHECNERIKAEDANDKFLSEFKKASDSYGGIDAFIAAMRDHARQVGNDESSAIAQIDKEIEKNAGRIQNAQQLMLDGQLEASDYKDIKKRYEPIIDQLIRKKAEVSLLGFNVKEYVEFSADLVKHFRKYFEKADPKAQKQILSCFLPEKLIFENGQYRTIRVNEVVRWIYFMDKGFSRKEKEKAPIFGSQSNQVPGTGFSIQCISID